MQASDSGDLVSSRWTYDGSTYNQEDFFAALSAVSELVRWANHAVKNAPNKCFPFASNLGDASSFLAETTSRMRQLLSQLATCSSNLEGNADLRHDGGGNPSKTAQDAAQLLKEAASECDRLSLTLDAAFNQLSHLAQA